MISTGHRSRSLVLSPATVLHFRRDAFVVSNRGLCCNYFRPVVERFRESVITTKNDQILFLFSFFPSLFFDAFSLLDRERKRKKERSAMISPSFFLRMRMFIDLDNPRCKYFISSILKYILTRQTSVLFINTQILNKIFHIFHYFENWREKEIHLFQSKRSRSRVEPSSYHDNFKFSRIIRKIIRLPNHLST